jgi:hypothetical protein
MDVYNCSMMSCVINVDVGLPLLRHYLSKELFHV